MAQCLTPQDQDKGLVNVLHWGAIRFFRHYSNTVQAEHLFKTALMVLEHVDDDTWRAEAEVRLKLDLGDLYYSGMGRLQEGEALTREALAMAECALGADHLCVALATANLAEIATLKGNFAESEPLYLRALAILDSEPSPHREGRAQCLASYAAMLRLAGREQDAVKIEARLAGQGAASPAPAAPEPASRVAVAPESESGPVTTEGVPAPAPESTVTDLPSRS